jgi:hypothetical protein
MWYVSCCSGGLAVRKAAAYLTANQPFLTSVRGGAVVKVLRYKWEGRWFDSRWCHWNFSLT